MTPLALQTCNKKFKGNEGDGPVARAGKPGRTGLTETQARALADWWGGKYQQVVDPTGSAACHGVIFPASVQHDAARPAIPETAIFSREEAQALEKFREALNPAAPDWVG